MAAQPSLTRIVNRAAVMLGTARRIASLDEADPIASAAREVIDAVRDELLASHPWNFAIRRDTLAAEAAPAIGGSGRYRNAYALPADCLRWLPDRPDDHGWGDAEQEGAMLLSDGDRKGGALPIRYIARIEDPSLWSPGFAAAMAAAIALEIGPTVRGDENMSLRLIRQLEDKIAKGKRQDGLASGRRGRMTAQLSGWLGARAVDAREYQYGPPIV